jgi:hypothetical protein
MGANSSDQVHANTLQCFIHFQTLALAHAPHQCKMLCLLSFNVGKNVLWLVYRTQAHAPSSSTLPAASTAAIPIFHAGASAHVHRMPISDSATAPAAVAAVPERGSDGTERAQCGGAYIVRPTSTAVASGTRVTRYCSRYQIPTRKRTHEPRFAT